MAEPRDLPLSWPHGPTRFEQRYGNAITRVVVAVLGIPVILGSVWLGGWAFFLLIAAASTGALLEFYWIAEKRGASPIKWLGVIAGLLLCLTFMHQPLSLLEGHSPGVMSAANSFEQRVLPFFVQLSSFVGIFLLLALVALSVQMFRRASDNPLFDVSASLAGVLYVSLCMATLIGIRQMPTIGLLPSFGASMVFVSGESVRSEYGTFLVFAILASIWICDSAAYYAGRAFGRHKLFERVSPKKTWEGSIAGALAAVGTMLGMRMWLLPFLSIGDAIALGIIAGVFGQLGDLAESHLKRAAGVKDSSHLIPGHGGVFDRFDSLLFVSPLVYLYLNGMPLLG